MATTIFTNALGTSRGDNQASFRNLLTITAGAQSQVRVTFKAGTDGLHVDNCSIGISNGTTMKTTATPVELLFSAAHGFTIAGSASITSDWASLSGFASTDKLVVTTDYAASGATQSSTDQSGTGNGTLWYLFGNNPSYNSADPTALGSWGSVAGWIFTVSLIETQSTGIPNKISQTNFAVKRASYY